MKTTRQKKKYPTWKPPYRKRRRILWLLTYRKSWFWELLEYFIVLTIITVIVILCGG